MKKTILLTMVAIPFLAVQSQAPAPAGFEHWTAAGLLALDKTLAAKAAWQMRKYYPARRCLSTTTSTLMRRGNWSAISTNLLAP